MIQIGLIVGIVLAVGAGILFLYPHVWGDVLYPLEYKDEIAKNADEFALERNFVAAVIFKESGFDPDAVSPAGARGLMQLLPSTAKAQAQRIAMTDYTPAKLFDPSANIRLGASYLRSQLDFCGGTKQAALVAYNAGCSLAKVYAQTGNASIVPRTTRAYLQGVLSAQDVYDQLYGVQWAQESEPKVFTPPQNDGGEFWKTLNPLNLIRKLF